MTDQACTAQTTIPDGPYRGVAVHCSGEHHSPVHHDGPVPGTSGHNGHPLQFAWPRPNQPPTDHRAEAEKWLTTASDPTNRLRSGRSVEKPYAERQVEALIGIGHAILAAFPDDDGGFEGLPPGATEEPE